MLRHTLKSGRNSGLFIHSGAGAGANRRLSDRIKMHSTVCRPDSLKADCTTAMRNWPMYLASASPTYVGHYGALNLYGSGFALIQFFTVSHTT